MAIKVNIPASAIRNGTMTPQQQEAYTAALQLKSRVDGLAGEFSSRKGQAPHHRESGVSADMYSFERFSDETGEATACIYERSHASMPSEVLGKWEWVDVEGHDDEVRTEMWGYRDYFPQSGSGSVVSMIGSGAILAGKVLGGRLIPRSFGHKLVDFGHRLQYRPTPCEKYQIYAQTPERVATYMEVGFNEGGDVWYTRASGDSGDRVPVRWDPITVGPTPDPPPI